MKRTLVAGLGQMGAHYVGKLLGLGYQEADIVAVDIDPEKVEKMRAKYPNTQYAGSVTEGLRFNPEVAIVATNTPSHHTVIRELMEGGVRHILAEKPLGLTLEAVDNIYPTMADTGTEIYTALLMNFSPAILHVMELMRAEKLILVEGSVVWGKNRFGDSRPTPGDLEDETVHGIGILHNLAEVNQELKRVEVTSMLSYPAFASEEAQAKAHALDPSFPTRANATSMVLERIVTNRTVAVLTLHSSFIYPVQTRRVSAVLARAEEPRKVVYSVEFNFDVKVNGEILDLLKVTTLSGNKVENLTFPVDKLGEQTATFIRSAEGTESDPRLTSYAEARAMVAFTEAVLESNENVRAWVPVFTETDVARLRVA